MHTAWLFLWDSPRLDGYGFPVGLLLPSCPESQMVMATSSRLKDPEPFQRSQLHFLPRQSPMDQPRPSPPQRRPHASPMVLASPLTQVVPDSCLVEPLALVEEAGNVLRRVAQQLILYQELDTLQYRPTGFST